MNIHLNANVEHCDNCPKESSKDTDGVILEFDEVQVGLCSKCFDEFMLLFNAIKKVL
jgi:hypothetical protein